MGLQLLLQVIEIKIYLGWKKFTHNMQARSINFG